MAIKKIELTVTDENDQEKVVVLKGEELNTYLAEQIAEHIGSRPNDRK